MLCTLISDRPNIYNSINKQFDMKPRVSVNFISSVTSCPGLQEKRSHKQPNHAHNMSVSHIGNCADRMVNSTQSNNICTVHYLYSPYITLRIRPGVFSDAANVK